MNCIDIQRKLSVAEPGRDDPGVRAHLDGCAECRAAERRERGLDALLDVARAERPDDHFEARLVARVRSEMADHKPALIPWTPARAWSLGLAAAAALLLFIWIPTLFTAQPPLPQMAAGSPAPPGAPAFPAEGMRRLSDDPLSASPASRSLFAAAPAHPVDSSFMPGLSLHEIPGAQSTLVLASTNTPLRLSPGGIQYGGESMMVDFNPPN